MNDMGGIAPLAGHPRAGLGSPRTWILGARGAPNEAPENTLAGLRHALEIGLDGVGYELARVRTGELVLFADQTLERTTDGLGAIAEKSWVELSSLDAGGSFDARFRGESIPLFEEALAIEAGPRPRAMHWIELCDRELVPDVARAIRELDPTIGVRVASYVRDVCLDARDAGLAAVFCAHRAHERERRFVREERLAGFATGMAGWRASEPEWPCERWSIGVDESDDLLAACRAGAFGFLTSEPRRALATRTLVELAPHDRGAFPIQVPELDMDFADGVGGRRGWFGSFVTSARVRNPFAFAVEARAEIVARRGAFEIDGLPTEFELAPGAEIDLSFRLSGGSWRAGRDPLVAVRYRWRAGARSRTQELVLEAPLRRRRTIALDTTARRLAMIHESPRDSDASMIVRRHRGYLLVSIENAGGLIEPHTLVHLDGRLHQGGRGVRIALPLDFDQRAEGVAFSCGMWAEVDGERRVRRWTSGVPDDSEAGAPGRLLSKRTA